MENKNTHIPYGLEYGRQLDTLKLSAFRFWSWLSVHPTTKTKSEAKVTILWSDFTSDGFPKWDFDKSQIEQEECTKEDRIKICDSVEMGQREDKCNAGVACDLPQVPLTERKTYA